MKLGTRKTLADLLQISGGAGMAGAWLLNSALPYGVWLFLFGISVAFLIMSGVVCPPFWWGNRTFTTPLTDSAHEEKVKVEDVMPDAPVKSRSPSASSYPKR